MGWADRAIERLKDGHDTTVQPRGNSMLPYIKSGAKVKIAPYGKHLPQVGDIVLCRVAGRQYLHFVKAVRGSRQKQQYQIANAKGRINGWVSIGNVFGRAVFTVGQEP